MSKRETFKTILSGEFRVELQPIDGGPKLVVHGHAHDKEMILNMIGVDDEVTWTRAMKVTLSDLNELVNRVQAAMEPQ